MEIIEFDLKKNMFFSTLESIKSVLILEKEKKYNEFYNKIFDISLSIIDKIQSVNKISYEQSFILIIALSPYFESIKKTINQEELLNEHKWLTKNISVETGVYFSYIFLNEAYPEINKELYKFNNKGNNDFLAFIRRIIEKIWKYLIYIKKVI